MTTTGSPHTEIISAIRLFHELWAATHCYVALQHRWWEEPFAYRWSPCASRYILSSFSSIPTSFMWDDNRVKLSLPLNRDNPPSIADIVWFTLNNVSENKHSKAFLAVHYRRPNSSSNIITLKLLFSYRKCAWALLKHHRMCVCVRGLAWLILKKRFAE